MSEVIETPRLGTVTPHQLDAALQRFGLGAFVSAAPVPYGLFGQNLFVTSTRGQFVLRGCPHYAWQFPTEQYFAQLIYEQSDVPTPDPYLLDTATDIFGWAYVLMPRMPGLQLADDAILGQLALPDRVGIAQAMARTVVQLKAISYPYAGRYAYETETIVPFSSDYRATIVAEVQTLLAESRTHADTTTATCVAWVERLMTRHRSAMEDSYAVGLVHGDYKEANLVVQPAAGGWQVSGLFDLMGVHFGDREADLARAVGHWLRTAPLCADAFVRAYLQAAPPARGFRERQLVYALHDCLVIWTYLQRHGGLPSAPLNTFQAWATPVIAYWEAFRP